MGSGSLAGFPVVDVKATLYDGSYHDVDSSVLAFQVGGIQCFLRQCGLNAGPAEVQRLARCWRRLQQAVYLWGGRSGQQLFMVLATPSSRPIATHATLGCTPDCRSLPCPSAPPTDCGAHGVPRGHEEGGRAAAGAHHEGGGQAAQGMHDVVA